jgi:hypothetical protein
MRLYQRHLEATAGWLMRSIAHGHGGSCAYYAPGLGWSPPYPETTGYLIPTLLDLALWTPALQTTTAARALGGWLLQIQHSDGSWRGGVHPPKKAARASVFNTAQILQGLVALYRATGEQRWLDAAERGANWLASGVDERGLWPSNDYRAEQTPSYYSYAAWPMLAVWRCGGNETTRAAAERVLRMVLDRRLQNGVFRHWGFAEDQPAFTHTIAYTLQGLLGAADLLDDWETYGEPALAALNTLARRAELRGGYLPGAFDERWKPAGSYVCLTGNTQVALCLLQWERRAADLRLVSAAARLVDYVCSTQWLRGPLPALRGAVAGSAPLWGRYMLLRYPNWAAKYHCDALMQLLARLRAELV